MGNYSQGIRVDNDLKYPSNRDIWALVLNFKSGGKIHDLDFGFSV